jgi:2-keto-4-pentenoate hydratase/2-oxohepta-3-ene-1,7-dioic acid hydratase in catechol pathway
VHVTLRVRRHVWNLRSQRCFRAIARGFANGKQRAGFALVHFSVQGNHLHLIVEAENAVRLARGIQGLAIRIARALNRLMQRRGRVFAGRYHAHALESPQETARSIVYVLRNFARHAARWGETVARTWIDPFSSAASRIVGAGPPPEQLSVPPRTWLLRIGWRRARGVACG